MEMDGAGGNINQSVWGWGGGQELSNRQQEHTQAADRPRGEPVRGQVRGVPPLSSKQNWVYLAAPLLPAHTQYTRPPEIFIEINRPSVGKCEHPV